MSHRKAKSAIVWIGIGGLLIWGVTKLVKKGLGLKSISISPIVSKNGILKKQISLQFLNPSSEDIFIKSLVCDIGFNGVVLAGIDTTKGFTLKALNKTIITFEFSISILGFIQLTKNILQGTAKLKTPIINLNGSANYLDYVFPFTFNVPLLK